MDWLEGDLGRGTRGAVSDTEPPENSVRPAGSQALEPPLFLGEVLPTSLGLIRAQLRSLWARGASMRAVAVLTTVDATIRARVAAAFIPIPNEAMLLLRFICERPISFAPWAPTGAGGGGTFALFPKGFVTPFSGPEAAGARLQRTLRGR